MDVAFGLILGFLFGIASQFVGSWLERKRRMEERSEGAARNLLGLFFQARHLFRKAYNYDSEVNDEKLASLTSQMRQEMALLDDAPRERLDQITEVLDDYWGAMQMSGATPYRVASLVTREAQESLRCVLRLQPLEPLMPQVEELRNSMVEYRSLEEETLRQAAERRKNGGD